MSFVTSQKQIDVEIICLIMNVASKMWFTQTSLNKLDRKVFL